MLASVSSSWISLRSSRVLAAEMAWVTRQFRRSLVSRALAGSMMSAWRFIFLPLSAVKRSKAMRASSGCWLVRMSRALAFA